MEILLIILIAIVVVFLLIKFKVPKLGNMTLITGGIKTGKSTLSVYLSYKQYKRNLFKWKIKRFFIKFFRKLKIKKFINTKIPEKPLFYSNIPIAVPYVPLTKELLLRKERFSYGSVAYICESSLVADSMSFGDKKINEELLLFNKLFAHETKGGSLFYDTQSVLDNHFAIKRTLSSYLYIHHTIKIPFFLLMYVKELKYSEDSTNVFKDDVEESGLQLIIVPKRVWKKFDCYCYSCLTDDLPVNKNVCVPVSLKAEDIVSFKEYLTLKEKKNKEGKDNEKICEKS